MEPLPTLGDNTGALSELCRLPSDGQRRVLVERMHDGSEGPLTTSSTMRLLKVVAYRVIR
jgi:hypothetical protein